MKHWTKSRAELKWRATRRKLHYSANNSKKEVRISISGRHAAGSGAEPARFHLQLTWSKCPIKTMRQFTIKLIDVLLEEISLRISNKVFDRSVIISTAIYRRKERFALFNAPSARHGSFVTWTLYFISTCQRFNKQLQRYVPLIENVQAPRIAGVSTSKTF